MNTSQQRLSIISNHTDCNLDIDLHSLEKINTLPPYEHNSTPHHLITTQIESSTTHSLPMYHLINTSPHKRKYSDSDSHVSAFKLVQGESIRKARSKSFNFTEMNPLHSIFHPVIIASEKTHCSNQLCNEFSENGEFVKIKGNKCFLCIKCYGYFNKDQYCSYCYQIYQDTSNTGAIVDGLDWIQCEHCTKWVWKLVASP